MEHIVSFKNNVRYKIGNVFLYIAASLDVLLSFLAIQQYEITSTR